MVKVFTTQRKLFLGPFAVILALPQMILLFPHVRIAIKTKVETRLNRQLRKIPITGIASPKFHPCCHRPGGLALLNLVHQVAQQDALHIIRPLLQQALAAGQYLPLTVTN